VKYYRELWNTGPVRTEARRLAAEMLREKYGAKVWDNMTQKQRDNHVTVLLFNSEDVFLKRAKWSLGL
jgi:hypothetical protein